MAKSIITCICNSCNCNIQKAQELLDGELRYLRDMENLGDLRLNDVEWACDGLGLERDYVEYLLQCLAS